MNRAGDWFDDEGAAVVEKEEGNWGATLLPRLETGVTLILLKDGLGVPVTESPLPRRVV